MPVYSTHLQEDELMAIDAVQAGMAGIRTTYDRLKDNAQDIAEVVVQSNTADQDNEARNQVQEVAQSEPIAQFTKRVPDDVQPDINELMVANKELGNLAKAQAKTLSTALDVLGSTTTIGSNIDVRS